jgi:hypothetical protein
MSSNRDLKYYEGPCETWGDARLHFRYYSSDTDAGKMVGVVASITFVLDRPASDVWPHFKDFNLWHNSCDHYYSGVLGDLEGKTFRLSKKPNEPGPHQYRVVKVIHEHLIEFDQRGSWEGGSQPFDGYGVYMLNNHGEKTLVTILMQHASRMEDKTQEEALDFWRRIVTDAHRKWRDAFIPTLEQLVAG